MEYFCIYLLEVVQDGHQLIFFDCEPESLLTPKLVNLDRKDLLPDQQTNSQGQKHQAASLHLSLAYERFE